MGDKKYRHSAYTAILVYLGISYIHTRLIHGLSARKPFTKRIKITILITIAITINDCNYRVRELCELVRSVRVFIEQSHYKIMFNTLSIKTV